MKPKIDIIRSSKDELVFRCDNLTIVELLRIYLNEDDSVKLAVWKREHPSIAPIMLVKTIGKSPKKALADAVKHIEKELDKLVTDFKKLK
jgi:DNA-directed RNA polymerase subunit L